MQTSYEQSLLRPTERVLSTLEEDGSRRWLYPRLARGRFLASRRIAAYLLIVVFTLIPYIRINGKPAILLDVAHRRFTFFGLTFLPTDTVLLALFMVGLLLAVFFVTALFGRIWCGWACPQTVYMEFVYRPIERLFTGRAGRGGAPKAAAPWRYALMYAAFLLASLFLAHTFLAYFVGIDQLRLWITRSPIDHPAAFIIMAVTTGLMMFDFAFFREQTCIIACPYGRLQSVLMDRQSLIIGYDAKRGEPRGKAGSGQRAAGSETTAAPPPATQGDCVACEMCVQVCPTGIDIRDGLQIECVGCAQCIDACDAVMDRIKRPRGLIRYSSQAAAEGQTPRILRPRVIIYACIILGLAGLLSYLIATKSPLDVTLLRNVGRPFIVNDAGQVENVLRVKLMNRTDQPMRLRFQAVGHAEVRVKASQETVEVGPSQAWTEPILVTAPARAFRPVGTLATIIRVSSEDGSLIIDRECRLLGPSNSASTTRGGDHARP